jgi:soluble lytic murein transglycosylase
LAVLLFVLVLTVGVGVAGARMRFPLHHLDDVTRFAGDIDPSWIMAVIMAESGFRPLAESPRGAQGLMQIMPETALWIAEMMGIRDFNPQDIWKPETNIAIGSYYLNWLHGRFDGDIRLVLAAYNAGQGNVRNWLSDPAYSADGVSLDVIPFSETRHYIDRVVFNQRVYARIIRFASFFRTRLD